MNCLHCNSPIKNPRPNKKYCSQKCKWEAWNNKHPRIVDQLDKLTDEQYKYIVERANCKNE